MEKDAEQGGDAAAWSALLSVLAHDLISPLTALRWQTELLLGSTSVAQAEQTKTLQEVHESVLTGIGIAQTVGYAVNVLRGDYHPVAQQCSPREVVAAVVDMLAPQFDRHRVNIHTQYGETPSMVTDPALLRLAVWSLLKRALAEAPSGTGVNLTLGTAGAEHSAMVTITADTGVLSGSPTNPTRLSLNATLVFLRILMTTATFLYGTVNEVGTRLILSVPVHTSS